ncbi:MAG: pyrroloquinoline quinone biosynthesis protein PqqB [candidate division NC10 bacterium]|nr:pyrroloquinoline quinone biosynthesis protein PqqB [candidate division NC10 bacterium]
MRVRVLGSGAGGGFPQWNCNCDNCRGVRSGTRRAKPRTQSSIAVSADGVRWYPINASPDIRQQIESFSALHATGSVRGTPIQAILLTNADIDHITGLLSLREFQPLCIYSTKQVMDWVLEPNAVFRAIRLFPSQCTWKTVITSGRHEIIGVDGRDSGLRYEAFAVPSKPPAYLMDLVSDWSEETIGYKITDVTSGRSLAYVPGIKQIDPEMLAILGGCNCLFFDGTFWSDDELIKLGIAQKSALAIGHIPIGGPDGSLRKLATLRDVRKIYIHINNTNPILIEDSSERQAVEDTGCEVAFDGMDLEV